ncbi:hypothetical protein A2U01_0027417, partial [Trifolium medium]|nr:hypothetical protein [Trifolium medium]
MVKEFWMKAQVFDEVSARMEEEDMIRKDPKLKGKTRKEMGLNNFSGTVIKSVLTGLEITISRAHLARLLNVEDCGKKIADYRSEICYRKFIKKELFHKEKPGGKSSSMKDLYIVLFKVLISNLIPRSGGTDTISWEHQHLLYFLDKEKKVNMIDLLFGYLCQAVRDSFSKNMSTVIYPRLLSELFYQTKLVQIFKKVHPELVEEERSQKIDASFLTKMNLKKQVIKSRNPLQAKIDDHFFYDGFPVISEADDEEVILNFLEDFKKSTGID